MNKPNCKLRNFMFKQTITFQYVFFYYYFWVWKNEMQFRWEIEYRLIRICKFHSQNTCYTLYSILYSAFMTANFCFVCQLNKLLYNTSVVYTTLDICCIKLYILLYKIAYLIA